MAPEPFRICRVCGREWGTWQEFLQDPSVRVVGLQAVPRHPEVSVLVFNHGRCGGISVRTALLRELVGEPGPTEAESEPCDGCFRDIGDLTGCDQPCVVAADRRLTLKILKMKGRSH